VTSGAGLTRWYLGAAFAVGLAGAGAAEAAPEPEGRWAVTGLLGISVYDATLGQTIGEPWTRTLGEDTLLGLAGSYQLMRFWRWFTLDAELGAGARLGQTEAAEGWAALYLRFDGFAWRERLYTSVGVSTGVNVVSRLPREETGRPWDPKPSRSHLLHYLSPEIAIALPHRRQHELVLRVHHRSGVYGTFNGVRGGSDVIAIGYRYRLPFH
jgi:hypothetical protein